MRRPPVVDQAVAGLPPKRYAGEVLRWLHELELRDALELLVRRYGDLRRLQQTGVSASTAAELLQLEDLDRCEARTKTGRPCPWRGRGWGHGASAGRWACGRHGGELQRDP